MFQVSDDRIDWHMIDNYNFSNNFLNPDAKILTLGAGSWEVEYVNDKVILVNKIYVDDEVNMPNMLIQRFRIGHVIDVFNDVLNNVNEKEGDG